MDWLSIINPTEWIRGVVTWFKRPRPEISFQYDRSRHPISEYCQFRFDPASNRESLFFRLKINNLGNKRIEEADVRVEKIEVVSSDGKKTNIASSPFFLHWANENTDNSRTIYSNTPVFLDVIYTVHGSDGRAFLFHKEKHSSTGIREFITPGDWIITIKLLGANISPLEKEISINFDGRWNELKMDLIK